MRAPACQRQFDGRAGIRVALFLHQRSQLASTAEGIAGGGHDTPPSPASNIAEIQTLAQALQCAAKATLERDQLAWLERLAHLGGKLQIASCPRGGTDALMRLPLEPDGGPALRRRES
ncbi:MAG TPA: hypothetical protein VIN58_19710 [Roseateles sp.]